MESGAESTQPEANENEDQEPQDAPDETTSITSCTAVTFTCHRLCFSIGMSSGAALSEENGKQRETVGYSVTAAF